MKLATLRGDGCTIAVRVESDGMTATVIEGFSDLSALLADPHWAQVAAEADGTPVSLHDADYGPVLPNPGKIVCVGLNYRTHIREMGREQPEFPTLFAKFKEALTGPYDDVIVPAYAANQLDWEAELAVIIGKKGYQIEQARASQYIAGYSVINDYTMRDFQYRTLQWDQGKSFDKSSGFGPFLDTDYALGTKIETRLDGEIMQSANTDDLVFSPTKLVEYISHIVTLQPGDVIATGTAGGVGHARQPPHFIQNDQIVEVTIEGLGSVRNRTVIRQNS